MQQAQSGGDGFEFLDDRSDRAQVAPAASAPLAAQPAAPAGNAPAETPETPVESTGVRPTTVAIAIDEPEAVVGPSAGAPAAAAASEPAAAVAPEVSVAAASEPTAPVPTLGEALVAGREARRLSLEQASARTRIGIKMLQHLEADRFDAFAADAYVRGTVRAYGTFLGLDVADLMARYEAATGAKPAATPLPLEFAPEAPPPVRRNGLRAAAAVAAVVVLGGLGYAGWTMRHQAPPLRPQAGLAQIETELRHAQSPPVSPAPAETAPAPAPAPHRTGEDTAPGSLAPSPVPLTDMVAVAPVPPPLTATVTAPVSPLPAAPTGRDSAPPVVPDDGSLVLTVTTSGPCSIRLVTDGSGRKGVLYRFERAGESRSWTARRSFRVVANRGANLALALNGRSIATPPDGRAKLLNSATLDPKPAPAVRRTRPRVKPKPPTPPQAPPAIEPHSGMLPPF
jgi:cytoskeleton protein RodZ